MDKLESVISDLKKLESNLNDLEKDKIFIEKIFIEKAKIFIEELLKRAVMSYEKIELQAILKRIDKNIISIGKLASQKLFLKLRFLMN